MKLSNFPYLIQKEILDHLSINNLFFLSLCSENTKNFIKETHKCQLKKVEQVIYSINKEFVLIDVKMINNIRTISFMTFTNINADYEKDPAVEMRVNVSGTSIVFLRYLEYRSNLYAVHYSSDNVKSIIQAIHNHLYDLLGHHTEFCLGNPYRTFCCLPVLRNIRLVYVEGDELTEVDEVLAKSSCLDYFAWISHAENIKKLGEQSKLYELDTVYVLTYGSLAMDVLKYFNGRHAFLRGLTDHITTAAIQFLNEWKSGAKFRNLEVISLKFVSFNIRELRKSVEFKELNTDVTYSFIARSRFYIVRKSDGRVASLMLKIDHVYMGVWDLTEEEFLLKFNESKETDHTSALDMHA